MPFTEAAIRLIASYPSYSVEAFSPEFIRHQARLLDVIEDQARAEGYAAGLAAAREAIEDCDEVGWDDAARSSDIHRAVALAAIDALKP